jgi:uncharacterized protein (TIGR00369 family)
MSFDPAAAGWRRFDDPAIPRVMASHWVREDAEGFSYLFETSEAQANGLGVVHGGILATYIDHTMGRVARESAGGKVATIQLDLQYLAPTSPGAFVEARGRIVRRTRSVIFLDGSLVVDAKQVLSASGIWKIIGAP